MPKVSIIVPNYNHSIFLEERLESIFNQTFQDFEVILLDDCSTDNSREVLEKYAVNEKVSHFIINKKNSGNTFIQWDKGLSLAKGEYIWIAESDDFCELNFLEKLVIPLLSSNEISLVYCQSNKVNNKSLKIGDWLSYTNSLDNSFFLNDFIFDGNKFIERFLIYKNVIPNASGVLFKKNKISKLDLEYFLKYNGDWLFYFKTITNNKVAYISENLNNHRCHSSSVISKVVKNKTRLYLIDIEIQTRKKIAQFITSNKQYNDLVIVEKNKKITRELFYEKYLYYFDKGEIIKSLFSLLFVFDIFLIKKYYRIRKINLRKFLR